jgi:hypothetical protein
MKFGLRRPSLSKRLAARASLKRVIRHRVGIKMPRGFGWVTSPRRFAYNRMYSRTTRGCVPMVLVVAIVAVAVTWAVRAAAY